MSDSSIKEKDVESSADASPPEIGEVLDVQNGDAALDFLKGEHTATEMSIDDERRLVRKIDWMIMPLMWCCYCLQYLDKTLSMASKERYLDTVDSC